jgi:DNA polymerase-3 subunit delta
MRIAYGELDRHLQGGDLAPVYVVTGDQDLLRELAVRKLKKSTVGEEATPFNYERLDGEKTTSRDVLDAANLLPMMGGRRFVLVSRAETLLAKSEELVSYLDDPARSTVLVLVPSKPPDRRRKSWKDVEKKAVVIACDTPKDRELAEWLGQHARELGLRLDRDAVRYLVTEFGSDMRRLANELEKLSLYASGESLDLETITSVLGRGRAQNVFKFTEAVADGHGAKALQLLGRLIEEGEPPLKILALVDRLVGQLRVARETSRSSRASGELARTLGVPPFVAKNLLRQAGRFERTELRQAAMAVAEADKVMKSSSVPERLALEGLVVRLAGRGRRTSASAV